MRVDTLASGIVHVVNEPRGADRLPEGWQVSEVVRLGSGLTGEEATQFGRIGGVVLDDAANVYVLDGSIPVVRVFGPDGSHVRDLGGPGDGPGEFRSASGIVLAADGRLYVAGRRYTAFNADGSLAGTWRRMGGGGSPVVANDGVIHESVQVIGSAQDLLTRRRERLFVGVVAEGDVMQPVDTIRRPVEMVNGWFAASGNLSGLFPVPFSAARHDHVDPRGGFWTGTTDTLRFVLLSADGDTLRIVERLATPRVVTDAERAAAIAELRRDFSEGVLAAEPDEVPDHMPLWSSFFVDPTGRLWVERYVPPNEIVAGDARTWEIYDADGRYLGVVDLPFLSRPTPAVRGNRIAGVVRDELDVEYVVVFEFSSMQ